ISLEAYEEYLSLRGANDFNIEDLLENKCPHCEPTNESKQRPPTHDVSACLHLFLLGAKIISEDHTNIVDNIKGPQLVFSDVLEAMINALTPKGKEQIISCLKRISLEGYEEYLNIKGANAFNIEGLLEDKSQHCDSTDDFRHDVSVPSHLFLHGTKTSANELVFSYILGAIINALTPKRKKKIISCLKSLVSPEEYLYRKGPRTPKTEGHLEDNQHCDSTKGSCQKPTTNAAFASSTSKKSKYSYNGFEDICEHFYPSRLIQDVLPEGLLLAQSIYCAKTALAFYNNEHGTKYKLVEPLSSGRLVECGMRFHCNFTAAKLKRDGSRTAQPKLFFANFESFNKKIRNIWCCIIDPAKAYFMCCEDCPPDLAHSEHGYHNMMYSLAVKYARPKVFEARKNGFYAEMALDIFNKKHGTMYKLVKPLKSNIVPISFGVYKFHCNFKAKLEDPTGSSVDASPKLFFGAIVKSILFSKGEGDCYILDATEGLDDHCSICRQGILHPADYTTPTPATPRGCM
ncbi:hypothetical protein SOVF_106270, partial [Spinacia oleracea]